MKHFFAIGFLFVSLCNGFLFNPFETSSITRSTIAYATPIEKEDNHVNHFKHISLKTGVERNQISNNYNKNNYFYAKEYYNFLLENKIINKPFFLLLGDTDYIKYAKEREENYQIFEKNLLMIQDYNNNNENCKLEMNQFGDEIYFQDTNNDMLNIHPDNTNIIDDNFYAVSKILKNPVEYLKRYSNLPPKKIWGKDILSNVKNQGRCGSCWAFSTTSSLESLMRIHNYTIDRLSEQQLVDCSKENNGCNGGLMHLAYQYIIKNNGMLSNTDYEYKAEDQICQINIEGDNSCECQQINEIEETPKECSCKNKEKNVIGSEIKDYEFIIPKSKVDIMASLQNGPIALALDASPFVFRFYKDGVIDIPPSASSNINHAVLLTGYNTDINGTYWIIQNSWGEKWGDNGYAKIRATDDEGVLLSQVYGVYPKY